MIKISDEAKTKIVDILTDEGVNFLRLGLQEDDIHGSRYYIESTNKKSEDDIEVEVGNGYGLLIDSLSMIYLKNTEINYRKDIMEHFLFSITRAEKNLIIVKIPLCFSE